jgi:predicted PurR-regulated permease PerM
MSSILSTFLAALILAYVLQPVALRLQQWRLPRPLSALVAVLLAIVAAFGLLLLLLNILSREIPQMKSQLPLWIEKSQEWMAPQFKRFNIELDWAELKAQMMERMSQQFSDNADTFISNMLDTLLSSGQTFIAALAGLVLVFFVMFYLLVDWATFFQRITDLIPPRYRLTAKTLAQEIDELLSQYLRGQLVVMAILAVYYATALYFLGMAGGVAIGVFTGVAAFIPYIGFGVGVLLAMISALMQFGPGLELLAVAGIYTVGQLVESFFLTPRLVGERIGLHPVVAVFALIAFGSLFGFFGVLLALPAAAISLVAYRFFKGRYKNSHWFKK